MNQAEQFAEDALHVESHAAFMAKSPDTAENFARYYGVMKHAMIAAGEALHRPFLHSNADGNKAHKPPRVGFIMPTASLLAHSVNLLTFLQGLDEIDSPTSANPLAQRTLIDPVVMTLDQPLDCFDQAYGQYRVVHCHGGGTLKSWTNVREQAERLSLAAMVFVSLARGMAFATSMGVAPKHIWWAHKWHGLELPKLDGYLDACHPFHDRKVIGAREWRCTYTALPELFDAGQTQAAQALRHSLGVRIVFGWMGRTTKITKAYLKVVAEILRAVPDSIFVYTGRGPADEKIQEVFDQFGVGDRVAFIGWVNTRLWAQVIDIYLDTFPFQSGHTAYEVMAAGKPVVWLHDDKMAEEQSVSGLIEATWEQGASDIFPMKPWNLTTESYVNQAINMATANADTRHVGGQMYRRWLETFLMDKRRMAESVSGAILEIING